MVCVLLVCLDDVRMFAKKHSVTIMSLCKVYYSAYDVEIISHSCVSPKYYLLHFEFIIVKVVLCSLRNRVSPDFISL